MTMLRKRIAALESKGGGSDLVPAIMGRETDLTSWLLAAGGDLAEKSAMWGHILSLVDGRSKGLPNGGAFA